MGIDEQKEEREVLDSIFPDEITGQLPAIALLIKLTFARHFRHSLPNIHRS
jgi:hypothetical protein